jgi:uncharacterized protein (TIGR02466 family)
LNEIDEIINATLPLETKKRMDIHGIFPIPVGSTKFHRALTDAENNYLLNLETTPNQGNVTSVDSYVLKNKKLSGLRQFIEDSLHEYFDATWNPDDGVSLAITQSWVNYTKKGEYHHKHAHPNSFVSGVFYINSDIGKDKIKFFHNNYEQIKILPKEWNSFNSESWWFPVATGELLLFPSSLTHMVETVIADDTRVSLSFNTFPTGLIGRDKSLNELNLR